MNALLKIADLIDAANDRIGRIVMWCAGLLVLVQFSVVVLRYAYGSSFIWMQESVVYLHAALFMLAIGYAYLQDGHVRVDVLYSHLSDRGRLFVDLFGIICFLMPAAAILSWMSWPFFITSFRSGEVSMNAGGLILWPAKLLLPVGFTLLLLQAVSELIKRIAALQGVITLDTKYEKPLQ
jgi:TRAP-type mannitol/chloroaromatic compound transport system permease small subunit